MATRAARAEGRKEAVCAHAQKSLERALHQLGKRGEEGRKVRRKRSNSPESVSAPQKTQREKEKRREKKSDAVRTQKRKRKKESQTKKKKRADGNSGCNILYVRLVHHLCHARNPLNALQSMSPSRP